MRSKIKYCQNYKEIQENQMLRNDALVYNQHNPYSPIEVPKRLEPEYSITYYNFKVMNVLDFVIEPTKDKDIIANIHPKGELRLEYSPLIESKLNLIFNGE
jgi:superfamily II helicase